MKIVIKNILLSILGVTLALFIAELITAKFSPQETLSFQKDESPKCFAKSEFLPFKLKNSARCRFEHEEFNHIANINSLGYRGSEFSHQKTNSKFRILVVGDSFTFGHGVEDYQTYPARLENFLRESNSKIEVINAGYASGFSPDSYYLYLQEEGFKLMPDLVIMGFFVWNDIADLKETEWIEVDQEGLPLKIKSRLRKVDNDGYLTFVKSKKRYRFPILRNSHLFQLIYSQKQSFLNKLIDKLDKNSSFDPEREANEIYDNCIFRENCFERYKAEWEKTKKVIMASKNLLDEKEVLFIIILIPTKEQVTNGWEDLSEKETLSVNRKLAEFFDENNIAYLDLYSRFKNEFSDNLYYKKDSHWSFGGHLKAAGEIKNYLINNIPIVKE